MRISLFNNFYISKNNLVQNKPKLCALKADTVSFSGKTNINYEMKNLPIEAFPSSELREFILQEINKDNEADIVELHRTYYAPLMECETLDEAKELYPEFEMVVDAKNLDLSKKPSNNIFSQIKAGKIDGLDIENLSLEFLKKYFAQIVPLNSEYIKDNFNVSYTAFNTLINALNIKMDKRYLKLLGLKLRAKNMQQTWQTTDLKERQQETFKKTVSTPEYKAKASKAAKERWQNQEYREHITNSIRQYARSEEGRKKTAQITTELWQNPEYRQKVTQNSAKRWEDPQEKERMSAITREKWQDPEFRQKTIEAERIALQDPEYRQKRSEISKKLWREDEAYKKKMKINNLASRLAWEVHPFAHEIYKETAKEFPDLKGALQAKTSKKPLTQRQMQVLNLYYKTCERKYPGLKKEIGEIQKKLLNDWGYYGENADYDKILAMLEKMGLK